LGTWYTLALRANGNQISVEVNGYTVIGPVTDTAFTSGNTGVWSYAPTSAGSHRFDNFSVTVLGGGVYRKVKVLAMTDARRRAVVSAPPANTTYRVYYYAGGKPIAMRVMPPNDATGTLYYLHSDHLGSTSVTTNASGGVVARQWYYPYGAVRGSVGTLPTQRTFTGQYAHDPGLGSLMYFNARSMSPVLGRFVSADTIVPEPGNPQDLNRYTYARNNPIRYTDSSGHCIDGISTAVCLFVAVIIAGGGAGAIHYQWNVNGNSWWAEGGDPAGTLMAAGDGAALTAAVATTAVEAALALPLTVAYVGAKLNNSGTGPTPLVVPNGTRCCNDGRLRIPAGGLHLEDDSSLMIYGEAQASTGRVNIALGTGSQLHATGGINSGGNGIKITGNGSVGVGELRDAQAVITVGGANPPNLPNIVTSISAGRSVNVGGNIVMDKVVYRYGGGPGMR
jgi:RHS repeat-associated protein